MIVEFFDKDDRLVESMKIPSLSEGAQSVLARLREEQCVYFSIDLDDDRSLLVMGNGIRFVINDIVDGDAKWLYDLTSGEQHVELVPNDPSRTVKQCQSVDLPQAIQCLKQIESTESPPDGCEWR